MHAARVLSEPSCWLVSAPEVAARCCMCRCFLDLLLRGSLHTGKSDIFCSFLPRQCAGDSRQINEARRVLCRGGSDVTDDARVLSPDFQNRSERRQGRSAVFSNDHGPSRKFVDAPSPPRTFNLTSPHRYIIAHTPLEIRIDFNIPTQITQRPSRTLPIHNSPTLPNLTH